MKKKASALQKRIKSYFTLFEPLLAPKSNPLLAVEELRFAKQGSMDSGEFNAHVVKIAKRRRFPCAKAEERVMNEEGKELTVEFLIQQLGIKDCNAQHKSLSQLDSTTSVNFAAYDCQQNKGKSNKPK